ncbi:MULTISPECIES: aldehyde dehydrogenase family protein [unclassified Micromonospora]|uniref:aldehyde dehydrogenase family protein n=1 Tax=unclassified Micromonospora TaxID=2617518 RepID=UPI002FF06D2B
MTETITPCWIAGQPQMGDNVLHVIHPYDGRHVGTVSIPTAQQVEEALAAADAVQYTAAALPAHTRADALAHVSARLAERADEISRVITAETGKPLKWSRGEVARAASTFRFAAEEARRWSGELQRLDTETASAGRVAVTRRYPRGPVLAITPFNFPLNLVAHKVAPAIAVGAPVIVKPAPRTPLSALLLGELLAETDLPPGVFSVLPVGDDITVGLVHDARLPVVSFTGSAAVGWSIKDAVPRKHVTLELGGNAAALVCSDWSSATDLDWAARRIAAFASYQAGQSCISVQRVIADRTVYDELRERIVAATKALHTGDPWDERTDVGPLINDEATQRVASWVDEAVAAGATVLAGGFRDGTTYAPTILEGVPLNAKVWTEEVFGPVVSMAAATGLDEALRMVDESRHGLQAGVFTHVIQTAFQAYTRLNVGGVIVGDVPSYRADQMPYGGVKASGAGREGIRAAMEDYTEVRVLVFTGVSL